MKSKNKIPLKNVTRGCRIIILEIPEGKSKSQLIRMGISQGEFVKCIERLPGNTIVIEKNHREIAIGARLAESILVAYATQQAEK